MQFSEKTLEELNTIVKRYPDKMAATIPALHLVQRDFGYVSNEGVAYVAELLEQSVGHVESTVSFYTMFYRKEMGKNVIEVCHTLSCALLGAKSIVKHIKNKLGIEVGETTADGKFSLLKAECLGSCGTAPVIKVNNDYYENISTEKLDEIIAKLS